MPFQNVKRQVDTEHFDEIQIQKSHQNVTTNLQNSWECFSHFLKNSFNIFVKISMIINALWSFLKPAC